MEDTFDFDAPVMGELAGEFAGDEEPSFGETENWFSAPNYRHERRSRRKSSHAAADAISKQSNAGRRKKVTIVEPTKDEPTAKRQKMMTKPTIPKAPSFMSRKKLAKPVEIEETPSVAEADDKRKLGITQVKPFNFTNSRKSRPASTSHLSELLKYKVPKLPERKSTSNKRRKTTVIQPFNFMLREEQRKKEREANKPRQEEVSEEEVTFRKPLRTKRAKSASGAVFTRLAKPKVTEPKDQNKSVVPRLKRNDLSKVLAAPKEILKSTKTTTKPVSPNFRIKKRATDRKILKEQNAVRIEQEDEAVQAAQAEQAQYEQQQLKEERADTVHKPTIARKYKPVPDKVSTITTVAVTPNFIKRRRR